MASATSADGGTWTVHGPVSKLEPQGRPAYAAGGIGAAFGTDGTFYSIWGDSAPGGGGFHVGLDPNAPDGELPGGLKVDPDVGVDSQSGQVFGAWNSLDDEGVVIMPLNPAAGRASIPNSAPQLQYRVGITGRIGAPGVFVAYAQGSNQFLADPAVYRADTGATKRLTTKDGELVSIAAAPTGRLWVFWKDAGTIYASRSNKAATCWGTIVRVRAPGGSTTICNLSGEGSLGPLDLLAHVDPPTGTLIASALFAGLTLLLNQVQRRQDDVAASDVESVRAALLTLEDYIAEWAEQAGGTNTIARHWADGLPETAGQAMDSLLDSMAGQSMWSASVDSALSRELPELIPPSFAVDRSSEVTLKRVLRVYAPEFYEFLVAFSRRREQLDAMAAELERRHATDGPEAVKAYLSELEQGARGLQEARRQLADFIADNFPIRDD